MYEQIYNLTSIFFKSLKSNLMYEFLISKFNGKRDPQRKLSLEQIVALNTYRFHFKTGDFENEWKKMELNLKQLQMFRHFFYSIAAYIINRNLDFYQNFFRLRLI